jgi:PPOX class probable FMN-dependent enzyme
MHTIDTLEALQALFDAPPVTSLRKEVSWLYPSYQRWIEASPFAVLATVGPDGLDASPRGDPPGLVTIQDERTLLLPERRGNNRIDSLRNIVADPRVALLFLTPGIGETMRVNGRARITVAPELLTRFAMQGVAPKCVLEISVDTVYFQCARAIHRSRLWEAAVTGCVAEVPTAGAMLAAVSRGEVGGAEYDRRQPEQLRTTLY